MGAIGIKKHTSNNAKEPTLFNNVSSILEVANQNGQIKNGEVDVEQIIRQQFDDISLEFQPLDNDVSGELKYAEGKWLMIININHSKVRQRFTMGHELGHYIYHRRENSQFVDTLFYRQNELKSSIEYMADEFAASILMPEDFIKDFIRKGINTVAKLASTFNVSNEAMTYRLQDLNYKISY